MEQPQFNGSEQLKYEHFAGPEERRDIYELCENLARYLEEQKIRNVIFFDRSARPGWAGVDEYWNQNFKEEEKPHLYFVNPDGFDPEKRAMENAIRSDRSPEYLKGIIKFALQNRMLEFEENHRSQSTEGISEAEDQIRSRFEDVFSKYLMKDKDQPLVLFDTYLNLGLPMQDVRGTLQDLGFTDIRVVSIEDPIPQKRVPVAKLIGVDQKFYSRYPFEEESSVRKEGDVISVPGAHRGRKKGAELRAELRRIIREKGA